jgi:hypothetical protein
MSEVLLISIARDGIRELVESFGHSAVIFQFGGEFLQSDVIAETTCLLSEGN